MNKDFDYYYQNIKNSLMYATKEELLDFYENNKNDYLFDDFLNINCSNCVDCMMCKNCETCNECKNCKDCNSCENCNRCERCEHCKDCEHCKHCKDCNDLSDSLYHIENEFSQTYCDYVYDNNDD